MCKLKCMDSINILPIYKIWKTVSELLWFYNFHLPKKSDCVFLSLRPRVYYIIGTQYILNDWNYIFRYICHIKYLCMHYFMWSSQYLIYWFIFVLSNKKQILWDKFADMLCTRIPRLGGSGNCAPLAKPFA